ncbi:MAG: amino acid adenylation domain-containing protein [Aphanocapsa sp. GSE-SYN-MK-11-07L]|jgi:amino acid adenylation domain-containing protein|nr:amino acid adenylation domain-containing protein [Aphanocapsa sp. GSE-SYN-MK-11-07L]
MTPSIHEFLFNLSEQGIKLWVEGDRLRCNAPKQALTSDLQSQLTERKAEILQILHPADSGERSEADASVLPTLISHPADRYQPFPLTDIQQAYWMGRSGVFELSHVSTHLYLEVECHELHLGKFNRAWQRLIERHEMLRAIVRSDGQQQILKSVPAYDIEVLDLRGESPDSTASQLAEIRDWLSHQVLPSDQWPLFEIRATYHRENEEENQLRIHISYDLLTSDARSIELVFRELGQLTQNPDCVLKPLELSFRDYVLAEIALKDSRLYQRSQAYWQNRLPTLPPSPELPLEKNLTAIQSPRFVRRRNELERETWQRLKAKATHIGVTHSVLLLTAFAEILTVWSKSPRFTLNLTLFNRLPLHPQVNEIVGDFTSLNLLAIDHSGEGSFQARARQIQSQLWTDLEHRYYSGVKVLRDLARIRGDNTTPLAPVVFTSIMSQDVMGERSFPLDWLGEVVHFISQTPQVYLDHQVSEVGGALVLTWDALEEVFPPRLLDDLFAAYGHFLNRLANEEEIWQTSRRQLLPSAQVQQLAAINATDNTFDTPIAAQEPPLLHTLFFEQARLCPEQAAVVTSDCTLTYQALSDRVHQLDHQLRQLGVCPNQLIAVVMEKGWEQVVATLGILAAGAAYVPIDPALPTERQWHLFEEAQVQWVLTQSWLDAGLEWPETVKRLCVDTLCIDTLDASGPLTLLDPVQQPADLAYVIYTSGSTGKPKGVMIDHQGAVNTILDMNSRFGVTSGDRIFALSSLSFDLSVYDIFGTLAAGGTIVIPDAHLTKDPAHWLNLIEQQQVTIWNSVPALMQMLVEYATSHTPLSLQPLRLVLLSGDWLPLSLLEKIRTLCEKVQVISLGGATEASIWSILYLVEQIDPAWKSIPYGRPMANQHFYVLNEALEPCPIWVAGQLYIGGIGLAQGYWRNPEKTNASFITHPHTQERLYKTGDLGRYLPNGTIEFLGREDFQIKVNGHRIELGEIEATLQQHPAVGQAIVTVVGASLGASLGGSQGNQQLVAYVVPDSNLISKQPTNSPIQNLVEAHEPHQLEGVLVDPIERLEFKLKQPGLRSLPPNQSSIPLPKPEFDEDLIQAYWQRQSYRQFLDHPISLEQFSLFLSGLLQMKVEGSPLPKYRYASAGSLYPVQTYVYIQPNRVKGLEAGAYYYHPADHRLLLCSPSLPIQGSDYGINQPIFAQSAFSLFLIGQLSAISPLYGEFAKDFCLLEAGYISQLLMETAPQQEIGLCPIGTLAFEGVQDLFHLDASHVLLHSFVGGKIDLASITQGMQPAMSQQKPETLSEELSSICRAKLPNYMVPAAYVLLDALPLTPNGKVDRKALPVPGNLNPPDGAASVMPQTESEQIIASVWQEILQLEKVGVHDNFFELGGNSLLMVRVQVKLQEILDQELPIVELFKFPTIHSFAQYLSQDPDRKTSTDQGDERAKSRSDRQLLREQRKQSRQIHRLTNQ